MNRKAQGLSINVVIIAAIALVILVILILVVINANKRLGTNAGEQSCLAQGGECMLSCTSTTGTYNPIPNGDAYCRNADASKPLCCRYQFGG